MMQLRVIVLAIVAATGCNQILGIHGFDVDAPIPDTADARLPGRWQSVAVGLTHTCAIDTLQRLWCWGDNRNGEVGTGVIAPEVVSPTQIGNAMWSVVRTGGLFTCGIQIDQTLWCWGHNASGQLGIGNFKSEPAPIQVAGVWRQLTVGHQHACAIRADDDSSWCWGNNDYGTLGDGTTTPRAAPIKLGDGGLTTITAGTLHTCVLQTSDAAVHCTGDNGSGQLGNGTTTSTLTLTTMPGTWSQVAAGAGMTCALTLAGQLRCWGANQFGHLGDDTTINRASPVAVLIDGVDVADWVEIEPGYRHTCARRSDQSLWCWGDARWGQFGVELEKGESHVPIAVPGTWTAVSAGNVHTCAIDDQHALSCAGGNSHAELGDDAGIHRVPTQVAGTWRAVSAGDHATCAIRGDGRPTCVGDNALWQVGDGSNLTRQLMTPISPSAANVMAAGAGHSCGTNATGIHCWGANDSGQLGTGTFSSPVGIPQLISTRTFHSVAASHHTCGISDDSGLLCWGLNNFGQLGLGDHVNRSAGSTIMGLWKEVDTGALHTCAIAMNQQVYCWGRGSEGQLGNNATTDATAPVMVSLVATAVTTGGAHSCAIDSSDQAWCWGMNANGQLGVGDQTSRTVPTMLAGAWSKLAAGDSHTCGIRVDQKGTTLYSLWCWGSNVGGRLGDGTVLDRSTPIRVGNAVDWADVNAGADHTCATRLDGSLWCWGADDFGQLALGTAWRTMFVEVP